MAWTDSAGSADAAAAQTSAALGVDPGDYLEDVEREIVDGPHLPRSRWQEVAAILGASSKADQDQAGRLREALVLSGIEQVNRYLDVFLTEASSPRKSVVTKKLCDARPQIGQWFDAEAGRLEALIERRRALTIRDRTSALLQIATAAAANYRREKQERGLLDYDDLIDKTLAMLDGGASAWVHYKLDRGVDHVLIDEAQDTSPRQWDIVDHIISEFTSGAGARDGIVRTVFAVGDEKQSIFSFQGAAPREFDARRRSLHRKFVDAGLKFDPISFTYSFRSGPAILQSVDHVFRERGDLRQHSRGRNRLSDPPCARRRRSKPDRSLGAGGSRRPPGHRGLARAVRRGVGDSSGGEAFEAHPGRDQVAGRRRHHDRPRRQAPSAALRRRAGAGAAARQRCSTP